MPSELALALEPPERHQPEKAQAVFPSALLPEPEQSAPPPYAQD
jgi:hypothetical protein